MGAEDRKFHRGQIYVAVIGVVGILGAAVIGNWDKLFSSGREDQSSSTSTEQNSATPTPDCAVALDSPKDGATIRQRKLDSGRIEVELSFAWRPCPNAKRYHLLVSTPDGVKKMIDEDSLASITLDRKRRSNSGVQPRGWIWKVRPFIDGEWKAWSEERTLYINPPS
jgi:hypothetical protein